MLWEGHAMLPEGDAICRETVARLREGDAMAWERGLRLNLEGLPRKFNKKILLKGFI